VLVHASNGCLLRLRLILVSPPGVGVVVYPRVSSQLIAAGELLGATGKVASMGLLAGVSANVPGLVFQAVEGLVTERALVGARQFVGALCLLSAGQGPVGLDGRNSSGSHIAVVSLVFVLSVLHGVVIHEPRYVDG